MKLISDLHTHTLASGHAYGTIRENAQAAAERSSSSTCAALLSASGSRHSPPQSRGGGVPKPMAERITACGMGSMGMSRCSALRVYHPAGGGLSTTCSTAFV